MKADLAPSWKVAPSSSVQNEHVARKQARKLGRSAAVRACKSVLLSCVTLQRGGETLQVSKQTIDEHGYCC
jgi:hypothetical protein